MLSVIIPNLSQNSIIVRPLMSSPSAVNSSKFVKPLNAKCWQILNATPPMLVFIVPETSSPVFIRLLLKPTLSIKALPAHIILKLLGFIGCSKGEGRPITCPKSIIFWFVIKFQNYIIYKIFIPLSYCKFRYPI